jgi:hypothetical protein
LDEASALEYSQSLAQIGDGWWRQMVWAARQGIPAAMGMTVDEWRSTYYGHLHLPAPERREAVAELAAEGMKNTEIADVLGVDRTTVGRDKRADAHPEPAPAAQPEGLERADAHPEPAPGQTSLADVLAASTADAAEEANEELADLFTSDDDRSRNAFRRALGEVTTAQARIVEYHDRWTPEQRREIAAALTLARRDLKIAPGKLEVVR